MVNCGKTGSGLFTTRGHLLALTDKILEASIAAYRLFETREDGCLRVVITPWE